MRLRESSIIKLYKEIFKSSWTANPKHMCRDVGAMYTNCIKCSLTHNAILLDVCPSVIPLLCHFQPSILLSLIFRKTLGGPPRTYCHFYAFKKGFYTKHKVNNCTMNNWLDPATAFPFGVALHVLSVMWLGPSHMHKALNVSSKIGAVILTKYTCIVNWTTLYILSDSCTAQNPTT